MTTIQELKSAHLSILRHRLQVEADHECIAGSAEKQKAAQLQLEALDALIATALADPLSAREQGNALIDDDFGHVGLTPEDDAIAVVLNALNEVEESEVDDDLRETCRDALAAFEVIVKFIDGARRLLSAREQEKEKALSRSDPREPHTVGLWEVVSAAEDDEWGIRREGEGSGISIAQMMWRSDAEHVVALHNLSARETTPQEQEKDLSRSDQPQLRASESDQRGDDRDEPLYAAIGPGFSGATNSREEAESWIAANKGGALYGRI